jgi:hypothetical protein
MLSLHAYHAQTIATRTEKLMPRCSTRLIVILLFPAAAACESASTQRSGAPASEVSSAPGVMAAMTVPAGKPDSSTQATVTAVTNDVRALQKASPAVAIGKLPAHEQLVNGMLTNFESRIRAMHVQADPAWSSVIDSVRTDLARLPAMKAEALPAFLPQHLNRVMRIVACIQMVRS